MSAHRPASSPTAATWILAACCLAPAAVRGQELANLGAAADYALLGLQNGNVSINSGSIVTGDFGYSAGVTSTTNQKLGETLGDWTGTAYVHSAVAAFSSASNYRPTGGIVTDATQDARLAVANADALEVSAVIEDLPGTASVGAIVDQSLVLGTVDNVRTVHVVDIASLLMNSDVLELVGDAADVFVLRIRGDFRFSQSEVRLTGGVTPGHVLFYFPPSGNFTRNVLINKSATIFQGTILAPDLGSHAIEYHNPASFQGAIIAQRIRVHSDFSLVHVPFDGLVCTGPAPAVNANLPACNAATDPVLGSTLPIVGMDFQLDLTSTLPDSLVFTAVSLSAAQPLPLPGSACTLYPDLGLLVPLLPLGVTDAGGHWSVSVLLPAHCKLVGMELTLQSLVFSATPGPVPYLPGFLSNGVEFLMGVL